ncbi:MAG: hypothetical protein KatS3mg050_1267 [Litorilinea sp.]|nr:MAG: hypothetical protein KatS3mg050_1267 [Litorilinea sp.]
MRQDYGAFQARGAEILAVAPDTLEHARAFLQQNPLPFPCLVDESHQVFDQYDVQRRWLSLGQRPGLFLIDRDGLVRFAYVGTQQWEIPPNRQILAELDRFQEGPGG